MKPLIRLATVSFALEPSDALGPTEREALAALPACPSPGSSPFRVRLEIEPLFPHSPLAPEGLPVMTWRDGRLCVRHRRFQAEIDPHAGAARLYRASPDGYAVTAVLRAALLARLPVEGGLALHAAGLLVEGAGVAFFGPSGAGKSTLAAAAPHPVLSDELVVASKSSGLRLLPSGFWSSVPPPGAPGEGAPLRALVELAKSDRFVLERLPRPAALRRLLAVTTVPPVGCLWERALELLRDVVTETPVYRMGWALPAPPWERLSAELLPARPPARLGP